MYSVSVSLYLIDYLTANELKVLLYMKTLTRNNGNTCSLAINETAKILGMSNHTISSALKFMEEKEIIKKMFPERRFRQSNGTYKYQAPQYTINDYTFAAKIFNLMDRVEDKRKCIQEKRRSRTKG